MRLSSSAAFPASFALVLALAACGGPIGNGVTPCGGLQCGAGQYCFSPNQCVNGCTSDANCQDGASCVDINDVTGDGICENGSNGEEGEGEGEPPPDEGTCDGFADHAEACGLLRSEATAIKLVCDQASANEQAAMIACDSAESCDEFRACAGAECFSDADCNGAHCLQRSEVVDPFVDVPYTCQ